MITSTGNASRLYSSALPSIKPDLGAESKEKPDAAKLLSQTATDFYETLQRGEETSKAALGGKADPASVVEALAASELAIQTAVSVRDKVVEAYQEILRMPV